MDYYRSRFIDSFQANQLQHGGPSSTAHAYNYIVKLITIHYIPPHLLYNTYKGVDSMHIHSISLQVQPHYQSVMFNVLIWSTTSPLWISANFSCAWRTPSCITHWPRNYHRLTSVVTRGVSINSVI